MKPVILGIQFRRAETSVSHEQKCIATALETNADVAFISALDVDLPWDTPEELLKNINGVVLGGSGDFDFDGGRSEDDPDRMMSYAFLERLRPMFAYIFEHDIPTFGICYGHQLLGAFAGALVQNDNTQKKSKSHEVRLLADVHEHFLFADLPPSFHAIYGHKDSLDRVPEGATLLMEGGEACKVSALQYKNNIFSTQFHPELTYVDIIERIKSSPGYLPEGVAVESLFKDDNNANQLLQNFGLFVVQQQKAAT